MKALLLLTALMVSALPVKADETRLPYRAGMVSAIVAANCLVGKGDITEEQAKEIVKGFVNESPVLNAAYSWASTSDQASKAVKALAPYMNLECDGVILSDDEYKRLLLPYLK